MILLKVFIPLLPIVWLYNPMDSWFIAKILSLTWLNMKYVCTDK